MKKLLILALLSTTAQGQTRIETWDKTNYWTEETCQKELYHVMTRMDWNSLPSLEEGQYAAMKCEDYEKTRLYATESEAHSLRLQVVLLKKMLYINN